MKTITSWGKERYLITRVHLNMHQKFILGTLLSLTLNITSALLIFGLIAFKQFLTAFGQFCEKMYMDIVFQKCSMLFLATII